ncbi:MAG: nSTAND1 domain-containing NTPase [Planctomycetota bacterium]|jgi:WD40 repeat protein
MSDQITASVVRIFSEEGTVTGAGFLVSERHILTCAHVISQALKIPKNKSDVPVGRIHLDFPFLRIRRRSVARIVRWKRILTGVSGTQEPGEDIAVLELESDPPLGSKIARLVTSDNLWGHPFRAFGFPAAYDQGVWASGRLLAEQAGGLVQIEDVKRTGYFVEPGFSGTPVWDEQTDGIVGMVVASESRPEVRAAFVIPATVLVKVWPELAKRAIPPCPYQGLFAFREEDARFFYGREEFTGRLVKTVCEKSLVVVIGSSGSGKSSVVFAGLLPTLRQDGKWLITDFRPGDHPIRALAAAMIPLLEPEMSKTDRLSEIRKLATKLDDGDLKLQDVIRQILKDNPSASLVLVADQFEELYTLCQDDNQRERFLNGLLEAVRTYSHSQTAKFTLVLTVRADFLGSIISYRPFADVIQGADLKLGPMNRDELRDVVEKPAQKLGVKFEEGLTERILEAVDEEPGDLPLLEFALTQLWARQTNNRLTHATYDEIGGIEKALTRYAEDVYGVLSEDDQKKTQSVFVQLARPGEGTEDTRRIAKQNEMAEEKWGLVTQLANARLVVTGRDDKGDQTVEMVHETLIKNWTRLKRWLDEDREFLLWRQRLRVHLNEWRSAKRDEGALLHGALLGEAKKWLAGRALDMSESECGFIRQSVASRELEQIARQRRRKLAIAVLAAFTLVTFTLAVVAFRQWGRAEKEGKKALAQKLVAQAELMTSQQPSLQQRSVLLAAESMSLHRSLEADQSLRNAMSFLAKPVAVRENDGAIRDILFSPTEKVKYVATSGRRNTVSAIFVWDTIDDEHEEPMRITHEDPVSHFALSRDGKYLATAGDTTVRIYGASDPSDRRVLSHDGAFGVEDVSFGPNGEHLAVATATAGGDGVVWLWDLESSPPRCLRTYDCDDVVQSVAFSSDGGYLAAACDDKTAIVWNAISGDVEAGPIKHGAVVHQVAFGATQDRLATASGPDLVQVWTLNAGGGRELFSIKHETTVQHVAFSPDGKYLATTNGHTAQVWDANDGAELTRINHEDAILSVAFSPDGKSIATAGRDGTTRLWETIASDEAVRVDHNDVVIALAFCPDGESVVSASNDGIVRRAYMDGGGTITYPKAENAVDRMAFRPDGETLVAVRGGETLRLWDIAKDTWSEPLLEEHSVSDIRLTPDGVQVAVITDDQAVELWNISDGGNQRPVRLPHTYSVGGAVMSPDGSYVATHCRDKQVFLWDSFAKEPKKPRRSVSCEGEVFYVAFSPNGKYLAAVIKQTVVSVWDVPGCENRIDMHYDENGPEVSCIAFDPEGEYLATGNASGTVSVWDTSTGDEVSRMKHDEEVCSIAFSSDGKYLATSGVDKTARVWWGPKGLLEEARLRLTRNMTYEEWQEYFPGRSYPRTRPDLDIHPSLMRARAQAR